MRVSFEYQAGVCLWADDEAARERWTSAIDARAVGLPTPLAEEAEQLMQRWDAAFSPDDPGAGPHWDFAAEQEFWMGVDAWAERARATLAREGVEVVVSPPPVALTTPAPAPGELAGPEEASAETVVGFEGEVFACFADDTTRGSAAAKYLADYTWRETATWAGNGFPFRERERTPVELLSALEREPGFIIGWWQEREGGPEIMLAGDPVEHAIECVRTRNATGLVNFLEWESVRRVHLGESLEGATWTPTKRHRLASEKSGVWAWFSFLRNATAAVKGDAVSERYKNSERERLWWTWTRGGSRRGWPATWAEALERAGLRRETFSRWAKPDPKP